MLSFIDRDYSRQIQVLYFIKNSFSPVTTDEIADHIGSSTKTVLAILPVIKNDISMLNFNLKKTKDRKYYLKSEIKDRQICLDEYILFCGKRSLVFSIIEELFHKEKINTVEFCNKRYISQATFSRGKKKIIELLAICDLKLPTYLNGGIIGNENKIRIFYLNFFFSFYGSVEWPFEENIKKNFERFFELKLGELFTSINPKEKNKFYYLIYIIKKRVIKGELIHEKMISFEEVENYEKYYNFMREYLGIYKITDAAIIKNETNFFICAIYTQEIVEFNLSSSFSKNKFEKVIVNLWLDELKKQFNQLITNEEEKFWENRLDLLHISYKYLYYPKKLFSKYELFENNIEKYNPELLKKTHEFFFELMKNKHYKEYRQTQLAHISQSSIIEEYYHYLYCFFYSLKKITKIPIFISDSVGKITKIIIEKQLKIIFGDNIVMRNKIDNQVELIVTSEAYHKNGIDVFIIYSYQDEKVFYKITNRIQEKIYKQL